MSVLGPIIAIILFLLVLPASLFKLAEFGDGGVKNVKKP